MARGLLSNKKTWASMLFEFQGELEKASCSRSSELSEDDVEALKVAKRVLGQIEEHINSTPETEKELSHLLKGIHMLLLHCAVLINVLGQEASDLTTDVAQAYKMLLRGKKKLPAMKTENDKKAVDVLVDALLALLARPSHLLRDLVETVFKLLCHIITVDSFKAIFQSIAKDDALSIEEDEDEDNSEDVLNDQANEDGGDFEEEEEEEEEEAEKEEESDPDEVADMDSPEEQKRLAAFDKKLSEFFALQKNEKKKSTAHIEAANFKTKLCDIVSTFIHHTPPESPVLLSMIVPMYDVIIESEKNKAASAFAAKLKNIFVNQLCKPKVRATAINTKAANEILLKMLRNVRNKNPKSASLASSAVFHLLKILLGIDPASASNTEELPVLLEHEEPKNEEEKKEEEGEEEEEEEEGKKPKKSKKKGEPKKNEIVMPIADKSEILPLNFGSIDVPAVQGALNYLFSEVISNRHSVQISFFGSLISLVPRVAFMLSHMLLTKGAEAKFVHWRVQAIEVFAKILKNGKEDVKVVLPLLIKPIASFFPKALHRENAKPRSLIPLIKSLKSVLFFSKRRDPEGYENLRSAIAESVKGTFTELSKHDAPSLRRFLASASNLIWGNFEDFPELVASCSKEAILEKKKLKQQAKLLKKKQKAVREESSEKRKAFAEQKLKVNQAGEEEEEDEEDMEEEGMDGQGFDAEDFDSDAGDDDFDDDDDDEGSEDFDDDDEDEDEDEMKPQKKNKSNKSPKKNAKPANPGKKTKRDEKEQKSSKKPNVDKKAKRVKKN